MKAPSTGNTAGGTLPAKAELNAQGANEQILHYEVRGKLGEGGMGVVYKAVDRKLNRLVALKFLPPHIDRSDVSLERFLQEANALSALNHPHIATIYTLEADGERQFLVLEYLPGGTLKAKLQQARTLGTSLSTEDVLKYAQQTAEGLAHAHARGIIHRDVKTSNLMLTEEGNVKVTDFGVAKLTGSSLRTLPGSLMGTIAYMSPEQVLGMEVDARSDAFSFGVALFELISGRLPFEAPNDAALLTKIANARVPPLREFRPDVPPELERIVGRALKKRREERYGSMSEVLADIRVLREGRPTQTRLGTRIQVPAVLGPRKRRWFLALVVATVFALIGAAVPFRSPLLLRAWRALQSSLTQPSTSKASTKQAPNQLGVLPFRFFGAEQVNEELAEDMTRALSRSLAELKFDGALTVLTPAEVLKEPVASFKQDDFRLRANLVLTGVVIQDRDGLTVAATLHDPKERIVVNVVETRGPIDQLPRLQGSLREKVAEILHTKIHEADGPRELCQQGRGYLQRYDRIQNLQNAISLFDRALARDPEYAPAHAGRAEAYLRKYDRIRDPLSLERAEASVAAAMKHNGQLGAAHFAMGLLRAARGDGEGAIESLQRSLQLEPASDAARELANRYGALNRLEAAEATHLQAIRMRPGYWADYKDLAVFYQKHRRLRDALPLFERVAQLAPDDHSSHTNLFAIYFKLRMYSEAAEAMQHAISIDPSAFAYYQLGTMFYQAHKYPEAVEAYKKSIQLNPNDGDTYGALGDAARFVKGMADVVSEAYEHAIALKEGELKIRPRDARLRADIASWLIASDKKRALREIRIALGLNPNDSRVQATAALVYELSGMREKAIASVEQAIKLGHSVEEIQGWPPLEKLRQDPRYKRIVSTSFEGATVKTSSN